MIQQGLGQNRRRSRRWRGYGGIALRISRLQDCLGVRWQRCEMRELFLIKVGADLELLGVRLSAQAPQESGFDHLGDFAFGFEMEFLAEHASCFDILNPVEKNERLEG